MQIRFRRNKFLFIFEVKSSSTNYFLSHLKFITIENEKDEIFRTKRKYFIFLLEI